MIFPIPDGVKPKGGWQRSGKTGISFGWNRGGGRRHAACDLVVPAGTEVLAVEGGKVLKVSTSEFIKGTGVYTISVKHDSGIVIRYAEVGNFPPGIANGVRVEEGDVIAHVMAFKTNPRRHMLHFELYAGTKAGTLSIPNSVRPKIAGTKKRKKPDDLTQEERDKIVKRGYDPDFFRRADLMDPTRFLTGLKDGIETVPMVMDAISIHPLSDAESDAIAKKIALIENPRLYVGPDAVESQD